MMVVFLLALLILGKARGTTKTKIINALTNLASKHGGPNFSSICDIMMLGDAKKINLPYNHLKNKPQNNFY